MKKKLSTLPSPAIAGVVREKTARAALAKIKNCICDGATMIDLHLSCLENTETGYLKNLITSSPLPILALNYNSTYDQQDALFSEDERIASLLRAIDAGADGIDIVGQEYLHSRFHVGYIDGTAAGGAPFVAVDAVDDKPSAVEGHDLVHHLEAAEAGAVGDVFPTLDS